MESGILVVPIMSFNWKEICHTDRGEAPTLQGLHLKDRLINGRLHFSNCVFPDNEFRVEPIISLLLPTHFSEKGIFETLCYTLRSR